MSYHVTSDFLVGSVFAEICGVAVIAFYPERFGVTLHHGHQRFVGGPFQCDQTFSVLTDSVHKGFRSRKVISP